MPVSLILLPGMDGTGDLFGPLLPELPSWIEPVVVSYPASEPLGYAALKDVVKESLPADRAFVILGESFSGPIAISIASEAPLGLRGVVLCASFARGPRPWLRPLGFLLRLVPVHLAARVLGSRMLMGRFESSALKSLMLRAIRRVSPEVLRARIRAVLAVDVSSELQATEVPVLYLQATEDSVVPESAAVAFARLARRGEVAKVAGPHFLLQCAPTEASRAITHFVERVQGGF